MFKGLTRDTTEVQKANDLKRNDAPYKLFEGAVIRNIIIKDFEIYNKLLFRFFIFI